MRSRIRGRHHIVVAYLALFVALGGSAVAAKPLIDGADVQDESLSGADIQNDSLTGADIAEASLGQVPSAATAGSATTAGDADTLDGKNSTDFLASNGLPGKVNIISATVSIPAGQSGHKVTFCDEGAKAISGGASWGTGTQYFVGRDLVLNTSSPWKADDRAWLGAGINNGSVAHDFTVWAACAT